MRLFREIGSIYSNRVLILKSIYYRVYDSILSLFNIDNERKTIVNYRKGICKNCKYKKEYNKEECVVPFFDCCSICGCAIDLKVRHKDSHCPIGKW